MSDLSETLDRCESTYRLRYANQPRVTRDPEDLERIVGELQEIAQRDVPEAARARTLIETYQREVERIRAARAVPYAVPAARLRLWSDMSRSRYVRSFAGRDRRTRDLALLLEIIADLDRIRAQMFRLHESAPHQGLEATAQAIEEQVGFYRAEAEEIRAARRTGSDADRASRLATLANDQFAAYGRMFAHQRRISRHPAALDRIVGALDEIRQEMQALSASGFTQANHTKNVDIVVERLQVYRTEQDAVRQARADATVAQRAGALGASANEVFKQYRDAFGGKPRTQADPEQLNVIFEQMWPIAREMDEIDAVYDDDANGENLQLVLDSLVLYAREYDLIVAAKKQP